MSWAAQAYVKSLRIAPNGKPLKATEKLLLLIMSEYYNPEEDMAWASVPELSKYSLLSERQTRRVLHSLVNKKVLVSIPRLRSNGATTSNGYRILELHHAPPDIAMSAPDMVSPSPPDIAVSPSPLSICQGAPDILTGAFLKPGSETKDLKTPLPLTSFGASPGAPPQKMKALKKCPENYEPGPSLRAWSADNFPTVDFDQALAAMRDHTYPSARTDWDAALRNWIRNEMKFHHNSKPSMAEIRAAREKDLIAWAAEKEAEHGHGPDLDP